MLVFIITTTIITNNNCSIWHLLYNIILFSLLNRMAIPSHEPEDPGECLKYARLVCIKSFIKVNGH